MWTNVRKRPFLVSILAIGLLVFGVVVIASLGLVTVSIYTFEARNSFSRLLQDFLLFAFQRFHVLGDYLPIFMFLNGVFLLAVGYGLWKLKRWAWWLYIVWQIGEVIWDTILQFGNLKASWLIDLLGISLVLYYFVTRRRYFRITTVFGTNVDVSRHLPIFPILHVPPQVKAGAVAGVLWAPFLIMDIMDVLNLTLTLALISPGHPEYAWIVIMGGAVMDGALVGAVVGVVFGRIRNILPGRSILVKALVLAVVMWLPTSLLRIPVGFLLPYSRDLLGNLFAGTLFSFLLRRWSSNTTA